MDPQGIGSQRPPGEPYDDRVTTCYGAARLARCAVRQEPRYPRLMISKIELPGGEEALEVATEAEFAEALETGLPLRAPPEVAEAFGLPSGEEDFGGHDHSQDEAITA